MLMLPKAANETSIKAPIGNPKATPTPAPTPKPVIPPGAKPSEGDQNDRLAADGWKSARRLAAVKLALDLGAIGKTIGDTAGSVGKSISEAAAPIGKSIADHKPFATDSALTNILAGAAAGGLTGAVTGVPKDREGKSHKLRNALIGMLIGGAGGGLVQPLGRETVKGYAQASSPKVQGLGALDEPINRGIKDLRGHVGNYASDNVIDNKLLWQVLSGQADKIKQRMGQ
jgi:hypothetical protein